MRSAKSVVVLLAIACASCSSKGDRRQHEVPLGGFSVRVALSARASSALEQARASILVKVYFDGEPRDKAVAVNDEGFVDLGHLEARLDVSGIAQFRAVALTESQAGRLASADYRVLVNVFSVGSGQLNLLACGGIQDRISAIRGTVWTIKCGSIGEPGYPR